MSDKQLLSGPHSVTLEMLRRDMARHAEKTPASGKAASVEAGIGEQVIPTAKPGQLFRGLSADGATASDQQNEWPFAISFERLKREMKK